MFLYSLAFAETGACIEAAAIAALGTDEVEEDDDDDNELVVVPVTVAIGLLP